MEHLVTLAVGLGILLAGIVGLLGFFWYGFGLSRPRDMTKVERRLHNAVSVVIVVVCSYFIGAVVLG